MLTVVVTGTAVAGLVLAALAAQVALRRGTSMGWSLAVMLVAVAWWGVAYAVELSLGDVGLRSRWGDAKYAGVVTLAPAWLVFVLQYTGGPVRVTRRLVALLAVAPVATLLVLVLPATHDLIRFYPDDVRPGELPVVGTGPLFWVVLGYNNLLILLASGLFIARLARLARTYRRMALILLMVALLPWGANLLHNFEVGWFARIDLTPFAFILTGGVLVWGLIGNRLLDLSPVGRSAVVESMVDAVFVLDPFGRIADVNPAGVLLAGTPGRLVGRTLPEALGTDDDLEDGRAVTLASGSTVPGTRSFDVARQHLVDDRGRSVGELVVLRDISERIRAEGRLRDVLEDRSRVAAALQASMVPPALPQVPGHELAMRYHPAGDGGEIGGDFLDVFRLGESAWGFVLGDVSGKGAEAAAVSAAARYTLRALAAADVAPSETLREVNRHLVAQTEVERHCTLVYGQLRPDPLACGSTTLTLSLAGHPAPLLVRADGSVEEVGTGGTILGLFDDVEVHDTEVRLAPGETLVLFTDGVVEARRGSELFGVEGLAAGLRGPGSTDVEALAEAALRAVHDFHGLHLADDLAMLLLRNSGVTC